jgi:hypothetical protein
VLNAVKLDIVRFAADIVQNVDFCEVKLVVERFDGIDADKPQLIRPTRMYNVQAMGERLSVSKGMDP